jgi:hypothetical protein
MLKPPIINLDHCKLPGEASAWVANFIPTGQPVDQLPGRLPELRYSALSAGFVASVPREGTSTCSPRSIGELVAITLLKLRTIEFPKEKKKERGHSSCRSITCK